MILGERLTVDHSSSCAEFEGLELALPLPEGGTERMEIAEGLLSTLISEASGRRVSRRLPVEQMLAILLGWVLWQTVSVCTLCSIIKRKFDMLENRIGTGLTTIGEMVTESPFPFLTPYCRQKEDQ